ncbi:hypothetical protein BDV36DRAFT_250771 [Aspergillus pseudocaelatus]|uniref:Uncharacterized protein n=1 Tax=Aspergillus pseudocaelatus TaxID=1825620 RepID=A0ABQ6WRK9_9EURO|nr:hypothetical protein BDV36DRAFT_250771 [Aspergillus pseudocaelatus]
MLAIIEVLLRRRVRGQAPSTSGGSLANPWLVFSPWMWVILVGLGLLRDARRLN